jgi:pimeloyl-ACP methyl ester carboxylesterase
LLLHGGSAHAHWWDWFAPLLAKRFRVMALDLRGHGDSEWAEPAAYDVEDYVNDTVAVIKALNLQQVRLVGHSLGGTVAAATAARVTEQLAALVIVDSWIPPDRESKASGVRFMQHLSRLRHPRYRTCEQGIAEYRLLPTGNPAPSEILAHVAAHALRPIPDGSGWTLKFDRATLGAIRAYDIRPALAQLACPILAVRGAISSHMPAKAIAALRAVAPRLEAVEIRAAHHHVMLEQPEEFAKVVGGFLERAETQSGC